MAGRTFEGRTALVTGAGDPQGIGFAAATLLGARGASLAIVSTTDRIHERAALRTLLRNDWFAVERQTAGELRIKLGERAKRLRQTRSAV